VLLLNPDVDFGLRIASLSFPVDKSEGPIESRCVFLPKQTTIEALLLLGLSETNHRWLVALSTRSNLSSF
jgi:hypothetical protein